MQIAAVFLRVLLFDDESVDNGTSKPAIVLHSVLFEDVTA
jgi:hypothetical protein